MPLQQKKLLLFFGIALIIGFGFSYSLWIYVGPGEIPNWLTATIVNQKIENKDNIPIMVSDYSDRCGSSGIFDRYERISYQTSNTDLYLVLKKKSSMIFETFNEYSINEEILVINVNVSYVDCIVVSKMYLFIPDIENFSEIQFNFTDSFEYL